MRQNWDKYIPNTSNRLQCLDSGYNLLKCKLDNPSACYMKGYLCINYPIYLSNLNFYSTYIKQAPNPGTSFKRDTIILCGQMSKWVIRPRVDVYSVMYKLPFHLKLKQFILVARCPLILKIFSYVEFVDWLNVDLTHKFFLFTICHLFWHQKCTFYTSKDMHMYFLKTL